MPILPQQNLQLVATILCLFSTEEIDALNAILAENCGKVVQVLPTTPNP